MSEVIKPAPAKGRAASINPAGRFERYASERVDHGWWHDEEDESAPATRVDRDASRTVIAFNRSPDVPFDRSVNPYRGCEHGCIYCFARPSHAYFGLSSGLDFETRLFAKPDAAALLRRELSHPNYRCRVLALGTNTDPYQPIERRLAITRGLLEVLAETNHPVGIVTKSAAILRDIDLLAPMAAQNLAHANLSVTTLDADLARKMEPRAATPTRRLKAIAALAQAGIPTSVMVAPVIPGLNDHEIEAILEQAAAAGARSASYVLLRLPFEIKDLFEEWLKRQYPDRAQHVLSLVRQTRSGKLYDSRFGERMAGQGPIAQLIGQRFDKAKRRFGLTDRDYKLDISRFAPPRAPTAQLSLF